MLKSCAEDPLIVTPYPNATRWDYWQATDVTQKLRAAADAEQAADVLLRHIFATHPDILDLPPAVRHRFQEASRVMGAFPGGAAILNDGILAHFERAEARFLSGYANAAAATLIGSDPSRPKPVSANGLLVQQVALPESVAHRGVVWSRWAQAQIKRGNMRKLFGEHPAWVGVKLGEGSWLQVGNLMIEAVEGLGRVRTRAHAPHNVEDTWSLNFGNDWGAGLDAWFVTTHIMDKELLILSEGLDNSMIDGPHLTPETYARSYVPILQLMRLNRRLKFQGVISDGTWAYSAELARAFPEQHVSQLHGIAGTVVELGTADELGMPAQINFATQNPERREAFLHGAYRVGIAARFIDEAGMLGVLRHFGMSEAV